MEPITKKVNVNVTKEQFQAYLEVQQGGEYNMFDPRARQASGLDKDTFMSIIKNYGELAELYK